MNRQQFLVAVAGVLLVLSLFFFGRTTPLKGTAHDVAKHQAGGSAVLSTEDVLSRAMEGLSMEQSARITALRTAITRGDLSTQKATLFDQLSHYWRDSIGFLPAALYYAGEKAKLENSGKNLNFAAHSFLTELRGISDPSLKTWMAKQAHDLFRKSLAMNPGNDSAKIGLGSTYFFGAGGGAPPMEGIRMIREVVDSDSTNTYGQFMLGYGSLVSGQWDRAISRFLKVLAREPQHTEAVFLLAEAYEKSGVMPEAIRWYEVGKKQVTNPELIGAIEDKIKSLK